MAWAWRTRYVIPGSHEVNLPLSTGCQSWPSRNSYPPASTKLMAWRPARSSGGSWCGTPSGWSKRHSETSGVRAKGTIRFTLTSQG